MSDKVGEAKPVGSGGAVSLILASTSPRRHELIKHLRIPFEIVPSGIDEVMDSRLEPEKLVASLAEQKAADVYAKLCQRRTNETLVVLGADTIVVLDGKFLGKPVDDADAAVMLRQLSGRCHEVYTGVVLLVGANSEQPRRFSTTEQSHVYFHQLSDDEIQAYIATREPMDKAGAYALQGTGSAFVEKIEGCFTNIIGLPIPRVVSLLRQAGVAVLGQAEALH
ncbi:MAG TPA: Maf family protein [Trichormus sp.]